MFSLNWIPSLDALRLDVVGIVAVLGEGCTARTIEASSLSWHHVLPRLLPAPQALLRHQQSERLATADGIVIGVYSGNYSPRLNHFCSLLHHRRLGRNEVELVHVKRLPDHACHHRDQAFGVSKFGVLSWLSFLGTAMAVGLIIGSVCAEDGFALLATILLAATSTVVGVASKWTLEFKIVEPQKDRKEDIPDSDLIIYYPTGSFRVIKCSEEIARLYFMQEICKPWVNDNWYRLLALLASFFLMLGLLFMGNAKVPLQLAFAAAYISLNACYWAVSAINPMVFHWAHDYQVETLKYYPPVKRHPDPIILKTKQNIKANVTNPLFGSGVTQEPSPIGTSSKLPQTFTSKSDHISDQPLRAKVPTEQQHDPGSQGLGEHRRKKFTDLESFKLRVQDFRRTNTAPIQGSFGDYFFKKDQPTENKEERRFTQALWITIALTGSGRWLKHNHIAPDTDVWDKWIDLAERRARSKRNDKGQLVPACTKEADGWYRLPAWNYDGTLKSLLRKEVEAKKHAPADPPTLGEILWGRPEPVSGGFLNMTIGTRIKLRRWAKDAKDRIEHGSLLPFPTHFPAPKPQPDVGDSQSI